MKILENFVSTTIKESLGVGGSFVFLPREGASTCSGYCSDYLFRWGSMALVGLRQSY